MSVYNNNTPLANDSPSKSQPELLGNTRAVNNVFEQNHENLTTGTGFHTVINPVTQTTPPAAEPNVGAFFALLDQNSIAQLFWTPPASQGGATVQITGATTSGSASGSYTQNLTIGGTTVVYTQWFTKLPAFSIKILQAIYTSSSSVTQTTTLLPFLDSSGGSNYFQTQPIMSITTSFAGTSPSAGSPISSPCFAGSAPSTPIGTYVNGQTFRVGATSSSTLQTYTAFIVGY
jgi:hypothetical protein